MMIVVNSCTNSIRPDLIEATCMYGFTWCRHALCRLSMSDTDLITLLTQAEVQFSAGVLAQSSIDLRRIMLGQGLLKMPSPLASYTLSSMRVPTQISSLRLSESGAWACWASSHLAQRSGHPPLTGQS